jgi:hypothetical protein
MSRGNISSFLLARNLINDSDKTRGTCCCAALVLDISSMIGAQDKNSVPSLPECFYSVNRTLLRGKMTGCKVSIPPVAKRYPLLYVFFWVISRPLNFICRRFGTLSVPSL